MNEKQQNRNTSQKRPQPQKKTLLQKSKTVKRKRRPPQRNVQMSDDKKIEMRTAQRRKKNKRKKLLIRTVVCAIFVVVGIVVTLTMFFNIEKITITGDSKYSSDEIISNSGVEISDNLIFLSDDNINKTISKKLPYIGSVKIKKHLPSTLEIIVDKTDAVYAVPQDGLYTLLNENGKVLEKDIEFVGENIILLNPGELISAELGNIAEIKDKSVLEKVKQVRDAYIECGYENITMIDVSNIYDISLVYDGRIKILLGETNKSNLIKKLQLGKSALDRQNEENNQYRGTINLTVEGKGYWSEEVITTAPAEETTIEGETSENKTNNSSGTTEKTSEKVTENTTKQE